MADFSPDFIPPSLIPPGVNDRRSRDFIATLSTLLKDFDTSALMIQNPLTVDARLLPVMTVELGMSEFLTPGLLEHHVRALLAAAPDIHAMTGTIAGVRRALAAIGVTVDWLQWWRQDPPGHHDTHEVVAYVNEHLFADQPALLTAETQIAVKRLIHSTQRWSQEIDFKLGAGFSSTSGFAGAVQSAALVHPAMSADTAMPQARVGAASAMQSAALIHRSVDAAIQHPKAGIALAAGVSTIQFLSVSMEVS